MTDKKVAVIGSSLTDSINKIIIIPRGLHGCSKTKDFTPDRGYGWYRKFESRSKKRNLK